LFWFRNRSPQNKKDRKENRFAAFKELGVRSQKLIKQGHCTQLHIPLQQI
jgi:hypothetical protein